MTISDQEKEAQSAIRIVKYYKFLMLVVGALQRCAAYIGQIAFIWATVVVLGGFVTSLSSYDFKLIAALLLTEGVRVFLVTSHIHLQTRLIRGHGYSRCFTFATTVLVKRMVKNGRFRPNRHQLIFNGSNALMHVFEVTTAAVSLAFSWKRIQSQDFRLASRNSTSGGADLFFGMQLFYILILVESSVFLATNILIWEPLVCSFMMVSYNAIDVGWCYVESVYLVSFTGLSEAWSMDYASFIVDNLLHPSHERPTTHGDENDDDTGVWINELKHLGWAERTEVSIIKGLLRLTGSGQRQDVRTVANEVLARVAVRVPDHIFRDRVMPAIGSEGGGRIPLLCFNQVVMIHFLHRVVSQGSKTDLPAEAVSKQASEYLIRSIVIGKAEVRSEAVKTLLMWWSDPYIYRNYEFKPAFIFHSLYQWGRRWFMVRGHPIGDRVQIDLHDCDDQSSDDSVQIDIDDPDDGIVKHIKKIFIQQVQTMKVMELFLSKVDFTLQESSTMNLSASIDRLLDANPPQYDECFDQVVGLVAAWIWFMEEDLFLQEFSKFDQLNRLKSKTRLKHLWNSISLRLANSASPLVSFLRPKSHTGAYPSQPGMGWGMPGR